MHASHEAQRLIGSRILGCRRVPRIKCDLGTRGLHDVGLGRRGVLGHAKLCDARVNKVLIIPAEERLGIQFRLTIKKSRTWRGVRFLSSGVTSGLTSYM